ncbi:hypothetical protein C8Q78DRAFT_368171 [Trametes maxima]|nr:hypothetical protein C8Q78DRAFT_368171 [Trametes maxima]
MRGQRSNPPILHCPYDPRRTLVSSVMFVGRHTKAVPVTHQRLANHHGAGRLRSALGVRKCLSSFRFRPPAASKFAPAQSTAPKQTMSSSRRVRPARRDMVKVTRSRARHVDPGAPASPVPCSLRHLSGSLGPRGMRVHPGSESACRSQRTCAAFAGPTQGRARRQPARWRIILAALR